MIRRGTITFISIILLFLLFTLILRSIVKIKLYDLQVQIQKEQIQNYELSSRMLQARFRKYLFGGNNYDDEIKMNVIESSIMNTRNINKETDVGVDEWIGLAVVNAVRALYFQSFITLYEDRDALLLLQYAFLMERNRKYESAIEKYTILIDKLSSKKNSDYAFVLLHDGYCKALVGQTDEAVKNLTEVTKVFAGTHYAETAYQLLQILNERKSILEKIERKYKDESSQAVALYTTGQYALALQKFEKVEKLKVPEKYVRARSLEETGRVAEAINDYVELVEQKKDEKIAKEANRRLLLIGNFYGGGEKIQKFATEAAKDLGDTQAVSKVQEANDLQMKPVIIEELKKMSEENKDSGELSEISEELVQDFATSEEKFSEKLDEKIEQKIEQKIEEIKNEPPPPKIGKTIVVSLSDGRTLQGNRIIYTKDEGIFDVRMGQFNITIPADIVNGFEVVDGLAVTKIMEDEEVKTFRVEKIKMKKGHVILYGNDLKEKFSMSQLVEIEVKR